MAENFDKTVSALMQGMEDFITTKTVVGEPIHIGDTTILPFCDVTFGVIASAKNEPQKKGGGGGMGGKMQPTALLVIKDGMTRVINIKDQDSISRIVNMVPDIVSHFTAGKGEEDPKVKEAVDEASKKKETF